MILLFVFSYFFFAKFEVDLPQIWYASTPLAVDIGQLYIDPNSWKQAHSKCKAVKFYAQQMRYDCPKEACGFANLTYFQKINTFKVLKDLNLEMSIEGGAIKEFDCVGHLLLQYFLKVVDNVNESGGRINHLDMDEPYFAAKQWCNLKDPKEIANRVVNNFINPLKGNITYNLEIGDIEPYPALEVDDIILWLDTLKTFGKVITHFHVDVDFHHVGKDKPKAKKDMLKLRDYCDANQLTFAVIINPAGYSPKNDKEYYDKTMENAQWWVDNLGKPGPGYPSSRVLFQSWENGGVPHNVPETVDYTGTKTLLDAVNLFKKEN